MVMKFYKRAFLSSYYDHYSTCVNEIQTKIKLGIDEKNANA